MATKDSPQSNLPKVSKLPLPATDSPLVIDLPDGQKLVIGKMSQGSVIEVATWRGTGRPDSRTSRLMLGMSSTQSADAMDKEDGDTNISKPVAPESGIDRYIFFTKQFMVKIWTAIKPVLFKVTPATKKLIVALQRRGLPKIKLTRKIKKPTVSVVTTVENSEIDAWLNKITEKAERSVALSAKRAATPIVKKKSSSIARKPAKKKKASR